MTNRKAVLLSSLLVLLAVVALAILSCGKSNTDTTEDTGTSFFPTVNV